MATLLGRFRWWIYATCFVILYSTGETESAARFLSEVPQEDYLPQALDGEISDYGVEAKISGRHYPKFINQNPYLEDRRDYFQSQYQSDRAFYQKTHNKHHHSSSFHHSHHKGHHHHASKNYHQHNHDYSHHHKHQQKAAAMKYSLRRDPVQWSTFNKKSPHSDYSDSLPEYLDDTQVVVAVDGEGGHRLGVHYDGMINPTLSTSRPPSPSFGRNTPRSFTVQSGNTAKLICSVLNVGDKSVSWMRHEDLHILTVDKYTYSTDKRLSVIFNEADQEWILQIQSVRQDDAGLYECQVSTKPVLSFIVSMNVVVPSARIISGPEIFVHRGSLINLTCIVDHTVERPSYIYWYHYNKMIDYEKAGDIVRVDKSGPNTISNLLVKDAAQKDSGKYSCRPSNGEDASVMLHVLNGEKQAAMQTNTSDRIGTSFTVIWAAISAGISAAIVSRRC